MSEEEKEDTPSFWSVVGENFIEGEKSALRFARGGAIVGAVLGTGLGIYLFDVFGLAGVGTGFVAGAVIGGVGSWLMYQFA